MVKNLAKEIEIEIDGSVFTVELLEKEAPKTCNAVLDVLAARGGSIEGEVVQARWSGCAVYILFPHLLPEVLEIEGVQGRIYGHQGDVLLIDFRNPTRYGNLDAQEFFIVYGDNAQFRMDWGPEVCNLFGKIRGNLEELKRVGERVWKTGAKKAIIRAR